MTAPPIAPAPVSTDADAAQLPPIQEVYGPQYPSLQDEPGKKTAFVHHLIKLTNPIAFTLSKNAARNAHYVAGRQWIAWNTQRREFREQPLEEYEIRVSMNHIRPILRARTQRLLSAAVDFTIIPDSNALEQRDRAQIGTNFLASRYRLARMSETEERALEYAYCGGCAALKSFWNPSIGPLQDATLAIPVQEVVIGPDGVPIMDPVSGQPAMQETGEVEEKPVTIEPGTGQIKLAQDGEQPARYHLGDTDTALRTVFQIRLNPEATGWRPADGLRWLIDSDTVPLSEAKRRFPSLASKLKSTDQSSPTAAAERSANTAVIRNPSSDPATALGLNTGMPMGSDQEPKCLVAEYWELEGPYFPTGRLIQIVGDQVAYDGPFPDGIFPYDPYFDEPSSGWAYGLASVNDMIDPQDVINRQWTAIAQETWEQGIGQFVAFDVPGIPDQLNREPRAVHKIPIRTMTANRGIRDVFMRMEHQNVPSDRWRMIEAAERALFDIGAYHEVTRGQVPPGVDSGVAITKLLEQEQGQLQKAVLARKETLISWGRKQLQLARRYYGDVERWIPVQRPDLGFMAEGIKGVDLPDPDRIHLELENFKPRSEAAFRADIKELMKDQLIPPDKGLRLLDLGRGVEGAYASQTRQYAKARQENLWMERGEASFQQIGEQPAMAQIQDPVTGAVREEPTGVMEPVMKVVIATPDQRPSMDGSPSLQVAGPDGPPVFVMPLLLPTLDDHAGHIEVHSEIALDVSKPWALRQLALAHCEEHSAELAKAAMQAPTSGAP